MSTSNPIEEALLQLRVKKKELDIEAKKIDSAITALEAIIVEERSIFDTKKYKEFPVSKWRGLLGPSPAEMSLSNAVRHYLSIAGSPVSAGEIAAVLLNAGIHHTSENFSQTITATLHRLEKETGEVVRAERGLWIINPKFGTDKANLNRRKE